MKVIPENILTSVTASSADANFPVTNVQDSHPKRVWKAASGVTHASLNCVIGSDASGEKTGLGIFNTNAISVVINVSDPNQLEWPDNDWPFINWVFSTPQVEKEVEQSGTSTSIWAEWDNQGTSIEVDIIITSGETVEAGVVAIGSILEFNDPEYGLKQGLVDYSILDENSNGSTYFKKRDTVRTFDCSMTVPRDDDFYSFLHNVARKKSYEPLPWRLTKLTGFEWVVYARFADMPSGTHDLVAHSKIKYGLIEVL